MHARTATAGDLKAAVGWACRCVIGLILFSLTAKLAAQQSIVQPDETLPGFRSQNVLESHGLDNVSPFSGDLGIVLPLGPQYTLSAFQAWQLKAFYSPHIWRMDSGRCPDDVGGPSTKHAYLRGDPTIGVGWTLSLGYVGLSDVGDAGLIGYFSPDGAFHQDGSDGSHIRITAIGNPATSYTVEFPDGSRHTFSNHFDVPHAVSGTSSQDFTELGWPATPMTPAKRWGLTQIEDSFRNVVLSVTYGNATYPWEVTSISLPTLGKNISVSWKEVYVATTVKWQVVDFIDFPVFGSVNKRHVTFGYQDAAFARNIYDNSAGFQQPCGTRSPPPSAPSAIVPSLASVTFSDTPASGSFSYPYQMSYYATANGVIQQQGALNQITLPTGGFITYTYAISGPTCTSDTCSPETFTSGSFPSDLGPHTRSAEWQSFLDKSIAVATRCESTGATPCPASATTTYTRKNFVVACITPCYQDPNIPGSGYDWDPYRMVRRVDVLSPGNDSGGTSQYLTRFYFHVAANVDSIYRDGGLELEHRFYEGATSSSAIRREVISCWDSAPGGNGCGYHTAAGPASLVFSDSTIQPAKRAEVTWYETAPSGSDGGTCPTGSTPCKASVNTDFDAVALQYKTTTSTNAHFPAGGGLTRVSFIEWTPVVDSTHYMLGTYDEKNETEGSAVIYRGFQFDTTGFLRGMWTSDQPYDVNNRSFLLRCRYPDTAGSLKWDFSASYDHTIGITPAPPPRPFVTLCSTYYSQYPGASIGWNSDAFGHIYSMAHGQLNSSSWVNQGGTDSPASIGWYAFNVSRDPAAGLISTSFDTAGVSTTYGYDQLGRVGQISPTGESPSFLCYDGTTNTRTTSYRAPSQVSPCPTSGPTGGIQTWQQYLYDGLGRLTREIRLMPAGAYAMRTHAYDSAGHVIADSEWQNCTSLTSDCLGAAPALTQYSNFDTFGRAQSVSRADGSNTQTSYLDGSITFSDTRKTVTVNNINGACTGTCSGGSSASTVYVSDVYGRLTSVIEPTGGGVTNYTYDVNGKLTTVSQGGSPVQTRNFLYDSFGFLRQETTPEKGTVDSTGTLAASGNKTGSLGNVRERTEAHGTASPQVHDLTYDAAGRVLTEMVNSVQYLQNSYDQAGHGSSAGKLTQRIGYNPLLSGQPTVTDSFTYSDSTLAGRLSSQQTVVTGAQSLTTTQSWVYSSLGLVGQHNHAQVTGTAPFIVTTSYDAGMPVAEYANGIPAVTGVGYRASGALALYSAGMGFGKNMVTTIQKDALFRPTDISTTREDLFTASFDTGTYTYDGVGNITNIGSDSFGYDSLSRLTSASLSGSGSQSYTYDLYGNLLTKGATTFCTGGTCQNNQVTALSAQYDGRGNLTSFTNESYGYDGLNRTISSSTGYTYVFDAADERVARVTPTLAWTFTLRDEGKRLSTEFSGGSAQRENVYLGNLLVAAFSGSTSIWTFYASDHLGTPRLVTDVLGSTVETRKNWPFGEQVTPSNSLERVRFASMEQDTEGGAGNDRYNDHARQHGSLLGRFLSPDRVGGTPATPQSWNRFAYAGSNPLRYLDPNGRELRSFQLERMRAIAGPAASRVSESGGRINVSFTVADLANNEGAKLLNDLVTSKYVYTYSEGPIVLTESGTQRVTGGIANLDNKPDARPHREKMSSERPPAGVDSTVVVDPNVQFYDSRKATEQVSPAASAFHELAEAFGRVDEDLSYQDAHAEAADRELRLIQQFPTFTEFPAGSLVYPWP